MKFIKNGIVWAVKSTAQADALISEGFTELKEDIKVEIKEDEVAVKEEKRTYTKSEIFTMKTVDLQRIAKDLGIEGAEELSGNKLKPIIMKELGL